MVRLVKMLATETEFDPWKCVWSSESIDSYGLSSNFHTHAVARVHVPTCIHTKLVHKGMLQEIPNTKPPTNVNSSYLNDRIDTLPLVFKKFVPYYKTQFWTNI